MSAISRIASAAAAGWLVLVVSIAVGGLRSDFVAGWAWGTTIAALLVWRDRKAREE